MKKSVGTRKKSNSLFKTNQSLLNKERFLGGSKNEK